MTTTTATSRTFRLPASYLDVATAKITATNRRLTRLHLPTYTYEVTDAPMAEITNVFGEVITTYAQVDITIHGETPRLGDWTPVATLVREGGGPVITRMWPGLDTEPNLAAVRGTDPVCQHCNKQRTRKDTYVIRHLVTGEMRQIGRTCLEAFTGVRITLAGWKALAEDPFEEFDGAGYGGNDARWPVEHVITTTLAVVALTGQWVSRARSHEEMRPATADAVADALSGTSTACAELRKALAPHMADAAAKMPLVLAHARRIADTDDSEYAQNLATVTAGEWVGPRNLALLASAVGVYARFERETVERAIRGESAWLGAVGDKLSVSGTVANVVVIPGDWRGSTTLLVVVDGDGNRVKWFASSLRQPVNVGDTLTLTGRVKAHGEYKGAKETVLTRCKITDLCFATPAVEPAVDEPAPF